MEFGLTSLALTTVPPISDKWQMRGLVSQICWFEAMSYTILCRESRAAAPEESVWQNCFGDPTYWWDSRWSGLNPLSPQFKHKDSKVSQWQNDGHKPAWLNSKLAKWDAGMQMHLEVMSPSDQGQDDTEGYGGPLEIGMCRKLCEDGHLSDAVDALNLLVQQGCHVDKYLYYRVLKRCIAHKDLAMGRRIHILTIMSGYEGDAFLATQLIGLFASHGSLEEAMQAFRKVCTPSTYNWSAIIFAYGRNGEAGQAIRLYQKMIESGTVEPGNRAYVAVLQSCATAGDLVAGREVHAHILACPEKADIFVQTALVNMYAKCGSVGDARRVFDRLPERNVVAWTAMLAGYSQQGMGQEALNLYCIMQQEGITTPDSVTFVCALQACASVGVGALDQGKQLHSHIRQRRLQDDVVLGGSLVNMYAKCGSLEDARFVFDRLPERNVVAWNAMLAGYAQQGMGQDALSLYNSSMQHDGLSIPDSVTYVCLLQACASVGVEALDQGKQLHSQIQGSGLLQDLVLGGSLVNMYAKCGSLDDARHVFDRIPKRDVVAWNSMLAGYTQHGMGEVALSLYSIMHQEGVTNPDCVTYVCLLQACASVGVAALGQGVQLHSQIQEQGLLEDVVLGGSLVNMYAKCGSLKDACQVFEGLPEKNVVAWNAMLGAYAQQGMGQEALNLYFSMQQEGVTIPDSVTYVCLLQACASVGVGALDQGKQLHTQIEEEGLQDNLVLGGSLVNMYVKCGSLGDACYVFDRLPERDVVALTVVLAGYVQEGLGQEALSLYNRLEREGLTTVDSVTYVCLLQACASVGLGAFDQGKQLHSQVQERGLQDDVVLGGSLVNMYAKCGTLENARFVFDTLSVRNVVAWNVMFAGYAQQGMGQDALDLYSSLQQEGLTTPDSGTYLCLLHACASLGVGALDRGKQLHSQMQESGLHEDLALGGSLVNMYVKCGSLDDARQVFDALPERDVVAWNSMLAGYAQHRLGQAALSLYSCMQQEGLTAPDCATFVCLLQACASVGLPALEQGKHLHLQIQEQVLQEDLLLGGSLVNMYAKCGSLEEARQVFERLPERNVVIWNAMLGAYAQHGMGQEALNLYSSLQQEGVTIPDSVTYVCLLQASASVGALDQGKQFHAEIEERGLQADVVVGGALVNMYAKCGNMFDSQQVFDSLPERSIEVWGALIGGYSSQGNSEVVFDLVERMRLEGIQLDGMTFLCVLTVCSHAGDVDKGREYFEAMKVDYGINPTNEHYTCMVDLLGRAGHLDEAVQMAKTMPFPPASTVWHTLLGACRKWNNVKIGLQAFEFAVNLDGEDTSSYVW